MTLQRDETLARSALSNCRTFDVLWRVSHLEYRGPRGFGRVGDHAFFNLGNKHIVRHRFVVGQVGVALGAIDVGHDDGVWLLFQIGWCVRVL
jgi:hypothetical protein